ncbi:MAG: hypothetical protein M3151_01070, partial [Actinomycetota bacterium]|nr:hypothetical protein [Actinomycetota bacterium]
CIGGAIEGGLLGWVFSMDGTLFAGPPPGFYAENPLGFLADLAWALLGVGLVGAVIGLVVGLAVGAVLGLPSAKLLGTFSDEG